MSLANPSAPSEILRQERLEAEVTTRAQGPGRRRLSPSLTPAVATARGLRATNQDRVCALRTLVGGEPAVLLAVADGIGGLPAGERSADLAVQVVGHYARYVIPEVPSGPPLRGVLADMLRAAGRWIWLWARDQGHAGAAGSTLVCALVWDRHYLVAHAGDSRCYRIGADRATLLTRDHTEPARLEREDRQATIEGRPPLLRRLTSALGWPTDPVVEITPAEGSAGAFEDAAAMLVCSDGLHSCVSEEDMHDVLLETRGVDDACRRLVALALERGSTDNVSVAAVEIGTLPRRSARA